MSNAAEAKKADGQSVRLETDLIRKAAIVAQYRGITIREFLTPFLTKPVQREYERVVAEMSAELGTPVG